MSKKVNSFVSLKEDTQVLHAKIIITEYSNDCCPKPISKTVKERNFPLQQVTEQELIQLRLTGKPGFVLKKDNCYFYTAIPKQLHISAQHLLGCSHMCGKSGAECSRLSASTDCDGGCQKVRDLLPEYYKSRGSKDYISLSKRIEKYKFITLGYQCFNTLNDTLVVAACDNYKKEVSSHLLVSSY